MVLKPQGFVGKENKLEKKLVIIISDGRNLRLVEVRWVYMWSCLVYFAFRFISTSSISVQRPSGNEEQGLSFCYLLIIVDSRIYFVRAQRDLPPEASDPGSITGVS